MMSQFRMYFSRVHESAIGGTVYVDACFQYSVQIADLLGDTEWTLKENKMGIYSTKLCISNQCCR